MEAQPSPAVDPASPRLAAVEPQAVSVSLEGDFAAGMRTRSVDASVRENFGSGQRHGPASLSAGGFATGMTRPVAGPPRRGEFCTGQRSEVVEADGDGEVTRSAGQR